MRMSHVWRNLPPSSRHLQTPYINIFLFLFGKTTEIPVRYGIKETEMLFYILFAVVMVPFSLIVDVVLLNSQELAHGWKLYDYVHYQAYRFSVREHRCVRACVRVVYSFFLGGAVGLSPQLRVLTMQP